MGSRGYGRRSGNDFAYGDDYGSSGGGERWDRERFERVRARSRGAPPSWETVRVEEEDDRYSRGGDRREIRIQLDDGRRGSRGGRQEREAEEEERSPPPRRRRPDFLEEDRYQVTGRELAPYRERWSRDYDPPPPRRQPARPSFYRRQSSLDTFDRRPLPKYGEEERDVNVSINVRPPPPPEPRYIEREYRYKEPEPIPEIRVRREREREIIRGPEKAEESSDSFEEVEIPRKKRGKTRMPKRLVHKAALVQLGYAFDDEDDFYIVRLALQKEQIDEVIKVSESYFDDNKVVYKFDETKMLEAPPPPPSIHEFVEDPPVEIIETVTTKIIENPTPSEYGRSQRGGRSEHRSVASRSSSEETERPAKGISRSVAASIRSPSPARSGRRGSSHPRAKGTEIEEEEESETIVGGPLVVLPERRKSRRDRDIKAEIRALEAEKRALKYDQEAEEKREKAERIRESEYEIIENRDRGTVRVEKDKRGKSRTRKPINDRLAKGLLLALT